VTAIPNTRSPAHSASPSPNKYPSAPPTNPNVPASARNNRTTRDTGPPIAFINPTSRRRSTASAAIDAKTQSAVSARINATVQNNNP
jgi:hypothetical protein